MQLASTRDMENICWPAIVARVEAQQRRPWWQRGWAEPGCILVYCRAMFDRLSHLHNLRRIEEQIARLESDVRRQEDVLAMLPAGYWEVPFIRARLTAARQRLAYRYAERQRIWVEMQG